MGSLIVETTIFPVMGKWVHELTEVDQVTKRANCSNCGPVTIYFKDKGRGRKYWHCIEARRQYQRQYQVAWQKRQPGYKEYSKQVSRRTLLRHHGLTEADYERMVAERASRCDLCREVAKETLCVDHDHKTMNIRGLLCRSCNLAIGLLRDRPEVAGRIPTYLNAKQSSV